jgi:hypothetical protein
MSRKVIRELTRLASLQLLDYRPLWVRLAPLCRPHVARLSFVLLLRAVGSDTRSTNLILTPRRNFSSRTWARAGLLADKGALRLRR